MGVKVYTTPSCPWCSRVKQYLKENDVKFEDIDVSKSQEKAREMVQKSGQMGVPVVEINDKIIVGFNEPEIKKALDL